MLAENDWTWAKTDLDQELGIANTADHTRLAGLVDEAFDRILTPKIGPGRVFVVKPNLGCSTDEKGGTTSLPLLEATLEKIQRDYAPSNVYVVESDGIAFRCEEVFEFLRLDDLCARHQASLVNLSRLPRQRTHFPSCRVMKEVDLPSVLLHDEPLLINLAKIKTHEIARFSGAIKNLYGLNPYIFKVEYHPFINDVLCDIYHIFRPALTIVDGLWAVNGRGPWTGDPVKLGILIASDDSLAADLASLQLIGWQPKAVEYLNSLLDASPTIRTQLESLNLPHLATFRYEPAARMTLFKERFALCAVPFLKRGLPLVFPSGRQLKMARYGPGGQFCRSMTSWSWPGSNQPKEEQR